MGVISFFPYQQPTTWLANFKSDVDLEISCYYDPVDYSAFDINEDKIKGTLQLWVQHSSISEDRRSSGIVREIVNAWNAETSSMSQAEFSCTSTSSDSTSITLNVVFEVMYADIETKMSLMLERMYLLIDRLTPVEFSEEQQRYNLLIRFLSVL